LSHAPYPAGALIKYPLGAGSSLQLEPEHFGASNMLAPAKEITLPFAPRNTNVVVIPFSVIAKRLSASLSRSASLRGLFDLLFNETQNSEA
jgi:hypothetical protein